jgi:hypothetical protein
LSRASAIAIAASIGVHLVVGVWIVQAAFHPFALPADEPTPTIEATTLSLTPPPTPTTRCTPIEAAMAIADARLNRRGRGDVGDADARNPKKGWRMTIWRTSQFDVFISAASFCRRRL